MPGTGTVYVDAKLSVIRRRAVGNGFHEELTILNHDDKPVDLTVRIEAGSRLRRPLRGQGRAAKKGKYSARVERGRLRARLRARDVQARDVDLGVGAGRRRQDWSDLHAQLEPHGAWTTDLDVVAAGRGVVRTAEARDAARNARGRAWS